MNDHDTVCLVCGLLPHLCQCIDEFDEQSWAEALRMREQDIETQGGE